MLINLCQRDMTVMSGRGVATIPGAQHPVWCDIQVETLATERVGGIDIPIYQEVAANFENLPVPEDNVYYIVPRKVALAAFDRPDLVYPADVLRDQSGRIVTCRRFRLP